MTFVSQLNPVELWQHFDTILTIPRGSKNEGAMRDYVKAVAEKHELSHRQDKTGNIVVDKPGSPGHENGAITILQSHLDMVNDKNEDVKHDFNKDPIKPRQEGDFLYATGTTLGSDNGIGVAAQLAVMEDTQMKHGPLELLFTVDEETGLTGASGLSPDLLKGSTLINLDTEEQGSLYVGCAGGVGMNIRLPLAFTPAPKNLAAARVKLHGLQGGHSGVDIHLQRANALKLVVRALQSVRSEFDFLLADLRGGNMHNAIPREGFATVLIEQSELEGFTNRLEREFQLCYREFKPVDAKMQWDISKQTQPGEALDTVTSERVLNLLNALPHGVISMSYDIPGLVETSTTMAIVKMQDNELLIHMSSRSSVESAIQALQARLASIAGLSGASVEAIEGYPGWKPDMNSRVLKLAKAVHKRVLGKEPAVRAIHAGLECGIIGKKYPNMDMISLGPEIRYPHSPNECVDIRSVDDFYRLLVALLEELA